MSTKNKLSYSVANQHHWQKSSIPVGLTIILLICLCQTLARGQQQEDSFTASENFFTFSEQDLARRHWLLHSIAPADTDPNITTGDPNANNLVVFNPFETRPANLLLFFGSNPRWNQHSSKAFLWTALEAGYRVITLDYKYQPPGTAYCVNSKDESCWRKFHEKKVFGIGTVPEINEPPASCILNRTIKLLQYLVRTYPDENWQQYLMAMGDKPNWDRIAVSGFSQSTGHAAFLAKRIRVARVVLDPGAPDHFCPPLGSAPPDKLRLADWLSWPSATPVDRWYGMYHEKEFEAPWLRVSYPLLGVPSNHIRICALEPSHPDPANQQYHWTVQEYPYAPRDENGNFIFRNAWAYVLGSGIRQ